MERIREKEGDGNPKDKPIRTFGWKSEDAYNDYVSTIISAIPDTQVRNRLEGKIMKEAERGNFHGIEKMLSNNRLSDASYAFRRMGGDSGPNGMWVQKGYSVLNEDGTYSKVDKDEVKTLKALTADYQSKNKNTTKKGYYSNAPTMLGTTRVLNPFGEFSQDSGAITVSGNGLELKAMREAGVIGK